MRYLFLSLFCLFLLNGCTSKDVQTKTRTLEQKKAEKKAFEDLEKELKKR